MWLQRYSFSTGRLVGARTHWWIDRKMVGWINGQTNGPIKKTLFNINGESGLFHERVIEQKNAWMDIWRMGGFVDGWVEFEYLLCIPPWMNTWFIWWFVISLRRSTSGWICNRFINWFILGRIHEWPNPNKNRWMNDLVDSWSYWSLD